MACERSGVPMPTLRMPSLRRPKKVLPPDAVVPPRRRAIVAAQACILILLLVVVIGARRSGRDDAPAEVASLAPTVPPVPTAPPTLPPTAAPPTTAPVPSTVPSTAPAAPVSTIGPIDVEPGTYDFATAASASTEPGEIIRLLLGDNTFEFVWNETGALQVTTSLVDSDEVTVIADQAAGQAYVRTSSDAPGTWGSLSVDEAMAALGIEFDGLEQYRKQKFRVEELPAPVPVGITAGELGDVMVYVLELEGDAIGSIDWDAFLGAPTDETELASIDRLEYRWSVTADNRLVEARGIVTTGPVTLTSTIEFELGEPFALPDPALVEPVDPADLPGGTVSLSA